MVDDRGRRGVDRVDSDSQKIVIERARWNAAAAAALAGSILRAPCFGIDDYRRAVRGGACLYRVAMLATGQVIGWVILRIERAANGAEGVILAASASLAGVSLVRQVLPAVESLFSNVKAIRVETARPGLVRELARQGYEASHMVMRKRVQA